MYGAGNIGRGFIGALLAQSGYRVTFVDISDIVVKHLNVHRCYPLRIVSNEGYEEVEISGVDAIHGSDSEGIAKGIGTADILAISVGANALTQIIPNLLAGLRLRWEMDATPLNVLLCENMMDVDKVVGRLLKEHLSPKERSLFDERVGLIETSIGRMVPIQTVDMQDGNPLRVCVERYDFLPIDKDAIRGEVPQIDRLVPFSPFSFYLRRKLYLHNMGHAVCAYLGLYTGKTFIYEAMDDAHIHLIVKEAMLESTIALSHEYDIPMEEIYRHVDDLLLRFTNRALGDTCARVGGDTARKLASTDRFIGAALLCRAHKILPIGIAVGTAAAIYQYLNENEIPQSDENAQGTLREVAKLEPQGEIGAMILEFYKLFRRGTKPKELYQVLQMKKMQTMTEVI
jgi:mannitol-1-phosphate 5-dehydrogenase